MAGEPNTVTHVRYADQPESKACTYVGQTIEGAVIEFCEEMKHDCPRSNSKRMIIASRGDRSWAFLAQPVTRYQVKHVTGIEGRDKERQATA